MACSPSTLVLSACYYERLTTDNRGARDPGRPSGTRGPLMTWLIAIFSATSGATEGQERKYAISAASIWQAVETALVLLMPQRSAGQDAS
jgi:hypothetical protein